MKREGDGIAQHIIFESTGRRESACCGVIGLNSQLQAKGGFDDDFPEDRFDDNDQLIELTPVERIELAEYMMRQWCEYGKVAALEIGKING